MNGPERELPSRIDTPLSIYNALLMEAKVPDDAFAELKNVDLVGCKNASDDLVGVLEDQITLDPEKCPKFSEFVEELAYEFLYLRSDFGLLRQIVKTFVTSGHRPILPEKLMKVKLKQLWLNSMGKGNYQPLHVHAGLFSFVVYVSIPYTLAEEHKLNYGVTDYKNKNGCTEFIDPFTHDSITLPVETKLEQNIALFPSWITHTVYPFKSDVRRVTVSGNIYLDKLL
tara:strand:+ start:781 stop:1461 length:681 start_codon:yes stop_codon:yes gene_type:complete